MPLKDYQIIEFVNQKAIIDSGFPPPGTIVRPKLELKRLPAFLRNNADARLVVGYYNFQEGLEQVWINSSKGDLVGVVHITEFDRWFRVTRRGTNKDYFGLRDYTGYAGAQIIREIEESEAARERAKRWRRGKTPRKAG